MTGKRRPNLWSRRTLALLFALIALTLLVGGYGFYRFETQRIRLDKFNELSAIGELKAGQIARWREERLNDGMNTTESPFFVKSVEAWLKDSGNLALRDEFIERLKLEMRTSDYADALLLDPDGRILLSAGNDTGLVDTATLTTIAQTLESKQALLSELFRSHDGNVYIDAVAPVVDANNQPIAVVVLRSDAAKFLYPLIQSWPIPSRSAETVVVRKEGDDVLFLNDLRFHAGSALSLRIPLTRSDNPAVRAVRGKQAMFEGKDYRGVEVLADLEPIANSSWFMVAKVDKSELLAEVNVLVTVVVTFVFIVIMLIAATIFTIERKRAAESLRETNAYLENLINYANAPIIVWNPQFCITRFNHAFEFLTGRSESEVIGQSIEILFPPAFVEASMASIRKTITGERWEVVEIKILHRDESVRTVLWNSATLFAVDGQTPIATIAQGQDITERKQTEEKLRASEEDLRESQRIARVGNWRLDIASNQVIWSDELYRMYGFDPTLPPPPYTEHRKLFTTESWDRLSTALANTTETGTPYELELETVRKDGSNGWMWVHGKTVLNASGITVGLMGAAQDITERKRAEEALRESEDKFSKAFQTSPYGITITSAEDGTFVEVNDAFTAMTGFTREGALAGSSVQLKLWVNEEDRQRVVADLRAGRVVVGQEYLFRTKNGAVITGQFSAQPIQLSRGPCILSSINDITDRKRAEEALTKQNTLFETLLKNLQIGVYMIEVPSGKPLLANEASLRLLGRGIMPEANSSNIAKVYDLYKSDSNEPYPNEELPLVVAMSGVSKHVDDMIVVKPDGTRTFLEVFGSPITDNHGHIWASLVSFQDITERKQAEDRIRSVLADLERSNKDLEQFAAVASHDLQEPLRMIASYTQLLAEQYEGQLDAKAKKYIAYAVDGATRMQRLVNDLLIYSRIATRGNPLETTDSHSILGEAIRNLAKMIEETKAIVTNDELPSVRGDASQLVQLFQNLLANAIKFRGEEFPRVHVSVRNDGREWVFSVRDNGIGIDRQYADRIFVIFQRLHTRQEYPGTGIGLAVCKRIVERHGGKIWIESEPGQRGSTFFFTIPKWERGDERRCVQRHSEKLLRSY
jgi:PAS domain S-box-containing protein